MNVVRFYKSLLAENDGLLKGNKQVINSYNFHILKIHVYMAVVISLGLTILSFVPSLSFFYQLTFQIFDAAFFVAFTCLAIACFVAGDFVERHPSPFMYVHIILMDAFAVVLNVVCLPGTPYTVALCFLLLIPMTFLDSRIRIILLNAAFLAIALPLSYYRNETGTFVIDLVNGVVFALVGVIVGSLAHLNYMRYLDLKEHELDRNVEILRAKNEAKSSFLANMSHEIRTPINAVLGLNEMILRESTEPNVLTYAGDIKNAGRTLVSIINDVLDFSKIEANKLVVIPTEYQLDAMMNDLVNMVSARAEERGLKLRVTIPEDTPNVLYGDDIRIKQCVLNLLTNAIKYTNEGYVDLVLSWRRVNSHDLSLTIKVTDTGSGIKSENLSKLFVSFERIDEKRYRTTEGTGLGLTITQRLLEKMDSCLHVESEYGNGSTFWFEIQQGIIKDVAIGNFADRLHTVVESKQTYRETFHAPNARILVVDDMKINLDVIRGLLKRTRIQIDTALSGNEALGMVQAHRYDMIFIDHRMPEMDGIETLHAIRSQEVAGNDYAPDLIPCVALTANAISGAREMYLKEGFADYISKPVDYIKLEELLMKYLPKMLVQKTAVSQADSVPAPTAEEAADTPMRETFLSAYSKIPEINASAALDFCGDEEVLKGAVRDYYESITPQSNLIETYAAQGDIKNYMILVHGLKSSSRLVGAERLSKEAAYLEQCAKDANTDEIAKRTPDLLAMFRAYKPGFAAVLGENPEEDAPPVPVIPAQTPEQKPREKMDDEQFASALSAVSECLQADDFAAAANILGMVEDYDLPPEISARTAQIKAAILQKDKETALQLLAEKS